MSYPKKCELGVQNEVCDLQMEPPALGYLSVAYGDKESDFLDKLKPCLRTESPEPS